MTVESIVCPIDKREEPPALTQIAFEQDRPSCIVRTHGVTPFPWIIGVDVLRGIADCEADRCRSVNVLVDRI